MSVTTEQNVHRSYLDGYSLNKMHNWSNFYRSIYVDCLPSIGHSLMSILQLPELDMAMKSPHICTCSFSNIILRMITRKTLILFWQHIDIGNYNLCCRFYAYLSNKTSCFTYKVLTTTEPGYFCRNWSLLSLLTAHVPFVTLPQPSAYSSKNH